MKKSFVSVILAVYNDESRIERAIESVKRQIFQEWELLCIDDGSIDNTSKILDGLSLTDDRIKVLHLSQNGGLGKARNIGLDRALGKYVCFLDSDDYLEKECLDILYSVAEETDSEQIYFGMNHIYEKGLNRNVLDKTQYFGENTTYSCYEGGEKFLCDMIQNNMLSFAGCRQFFKVHFLNQYSIRFPEGIYGEDVPFTVKAMIQSKKLCYLRKELYVYCHRQDSITTRVVDARKLYSMFRISMIFFEMWYENREWSLPAKWGGVYLFKRYIAYCRNIYMRLSAEEREHAKELLLGDVYDLELYSLLIEEQLSGSFVQEIDKEQLEKIKSYQSIIIYGAGNYAVDIYMLLKKQAIDIVGFAVTKHKDNVFEIDKKPVLCIEEWLEYKENALIIIGTSKNLEEGILKNLYELKYKNILSL